MWYFSALKRSRKYSNINHIKQEIEKVEEEEEELSNSNNKGRRQQSSPLSRYDKQTFRTWYFTAFNTT